MINSRFLTLCGIVLIAALSRLIPHPPNATPLAAIALFGGAYFSKKYLAFLVPFLSLFLSDLVIGIDPEMGAVYLSFAMIVGIGLLLQKRKSFLSLFSASLTSSVLFFLVTNFSVWLGGRLYPKTLSGLETCFIAAIPFFRNTLLGDLFYVTILFGAFALAEKKFPTLKASTWASEEAK
ncbi:MAG: hypothetical protein HYZ67_07455 [Chlamydiae bacterium]|nr:hypothetical protein [Chlamydiota bacterium]